MIALASGTEDWGLLFVILGVVLLFGAIWWLGMWLVLKAYRKWEKGELPRDSRWEIYPEDEEEEDE